MLPGLLGQIEQSSAALAEDGFVEAELVDDVVRERLVTAAAAFGFDRGQSVEAARLREPQVIVFEVAHELCLFGGEFGRVFAQVCFEQLLLVADPLPDLGFFVPAFTERHFRFFDGGLQHIEPFERFEDLVSKHAAGLLIGGDLILEELVFPVAGGLVQFSFQVEKLGLALFELQLFFVAAHLGRPEDILAGLDVRFVLLDEGLCPFDLLGSPLQTILQVGNLPVDAMQRAKRFIERAHRRRFRGGRE